MRVDNWPEILNEHIKLADTEEFKWGQFDCCLFAADFVKEITGTDYAKPFRGKYKTVKGAYSALKKYGRGKLVDTVSGILPTIPVPLAGRGDVVCTDLGGNDALGICVGEYSIFLTPEGGGKIKTLDCKMAWRVN